MTRINSAIHVSKLTDEHLLAEHREIKRICNRFELRQKINKFNDIPKEFTLGTGHEIFFIDKPVFTLNRYKSIYQECLKRNFNPTNYSNNWNVYRNSHFENNDYIPTQKDYDLLIQRISERLQNTSKTNWHYYGKAILKGKAIQILISK
jgi:hypothetical protein